jgi:hypothetical protein
MVDFQIEMGEQQQFREQQRTLPATAGHQWARTLTVCQLTRLLGPSTAVPDAAHAGCSVD